MTHTEKEHSRFCVFPKEISAENESRGACAQSRTQTTPILAALRRSELIGRPLGDDAFLDAISRRLNRVVTPRKRGRKPKGDVAGAEAKGQRRACHRNT